MEQIEIETINILLYNVIQLCPTPCYHNQNIDPQLWYTNTQFSSLKSYTYLYFLSSLYQQSGSVGKTFISQAWVECSSHGYDRPRVIKLRVVSFPLGSSTAKRPYKWMSVEHFKESSALKGHGCRLHVKMFIPSLAIGTYGWNILEKT